MSSNVLLQWLSFYDKEQISEQVINRASENIALSFGHEYKSVSKLRRRSVTSLLDYGHLEYADGKETSYQVCPSTLLEVDNAFTLFLGARKEQDIKFWQNCRGGKTIIESSGLITCLNNTTISRSYSQRFESWHKSYISIHTILSKLPQISYGSLNSIENSTLPVQRMKRYIPVRGEWGSEDFEKPGVYRQWDNLPPTVSPWIWLIREKSGNVSFKYIYSSEMASFALCACSVNQGVLKLNYSAEKKELDIISPPTVYLPLLLRRPLCWLSAGSGKASERNKYWNINEKAAKEVSRILNVNLENKK